MDAQHTGPGHAGRSLAQPNRENSWDNAFSIRLNSTFDVEIESVFVGFSINARNYSTLMTRCCCLPLSGLGHHLFRGCWNVASPRTADWVLDQTLH